MATIRDFRLKRLQRQIATLPADAKLLVLMLVGLARASSVVTDAPPYSMRIDWDPDDRIFVVSVPELPGCMTHGSTYEEAARKGAEAISSWVAAAREFGDPLPNPAVVCYPLDGEEVEPTHDRASA